jgi:hypothetical protein
MSKKWKIVIGVVMALLVVAVIALPIAGFVIFRNRVHEQGWAPAIRQWRPGQGVQPPQRGVQPPERGFRPYPYGFRPGYGVMGGHAFGPFRFVGGLVCLVFFVAVVALAFVLGRHWGRRHPGAMPAQPPQ